MPYVHVLSNITSTSISTAPAAKTIAKQSAKLLGMPDDSQLMAQLSLDTTTCFAGSDEVSVTPAVAFSTSNTNTLLLASWPSRPRS